MGGRGSSYTSTNSSANSDPNDPFEKKYSDEEINSFEYLAAAAYSVNSEGYDSDKEGYDDNCQRCVLAFEMTMRGHEVEALPSTKNDNDTVFNVLNDSQYWKNAFIAPDGKSMWHKMVMERITKGNIRSEKSIRAYTNKVMNRLHKEFADDNSRGILSWGWKDSNYGHTINVINHGGKLYFVDAQSNKTTTDLGRIIRNMDKNGLSFFRTDTAKINPKTNWGTFMKEVD